METTSAAGAESRERESVRRLSEGDRDGLEELIDRHGEALMRYLMSILHDRDAAEDAFQDTWVRVVERSRRFDTDRPFAPWLFRIARNRAYDHLRWRRRWSFFGLGADAGREALGAAMTVPATGMRVAEEEEVASRLLDGLEPRQREVVWLRFFRECSYEEIARISGLRLGTVKSRLRRALLRLAEQKARWEGAGDVRSER